MDVTLFETCSHVIIMTKKVDPGAEGGARISIKESSIKAIEIWQVLEKARLIGKVRLGEVNNFWICKSLYYRNINKVLP
jgi:hypothetical protein